MREDDERVRLCILSAIGGCVARSIRHGNPSINAAPRVHAVVNAVPARQAMLEQAGSEQAAQSEQLSALQVINRAAAGGEHRHEPPQSIVWVGQELDDVGTRPRHARVPKPAHVIGRATK